MTSDSGVGARGLRLRRGNFELSIDSIRADPGKLVALIGTNGSGKSTLLDAVGGQLPIDSGIVQICGRPAASLSARERARHLAAVPQEFEIPFAYSVREVVEFGRAPYLGMLGRMRPQDRAAVSAALAECDLEKFVARPLGDLSGGQRRRVALAVALAQDTPILLADEPSAHMDIARSLWCWRLLQSRARTGRAVLAAVHDLNFAAAFADYIYLLRDGRLLAEGPPDTVFSSANLAAGFGVAANVVLRDGRPRLDPLEITPVIAAPADAGSGGAGGERRGR